MIPRTALSEVLHRIDELADEAGIRVANVFHAGDGNLHPLVLFDAGKDGETERAEDVSGDILRLCLENGGSITGEHGVGADKAPYMADMFGPDDLDTMQLLRCAFDPRHLSNPGKVFPTPRLCGERPGPAAGCAPAAGGRPGGGLLMASAPPVSTRTSTHQPPTTRSTRCRGRRWPRRRGDRGRRRRAACRPLGRRPGSTGEAPPLLRLAAERGLRVVVRGRGTAVHWGVPPRGCRPGGQYRPARPGRRARGRRPGLRGRCRDDRSTPSTTHVRPARPAARPRPAAAGFQRRPAPWRPPAAARAGCCTALRATWCWASPWCGPTGSSPRRAARWSRTSPATTSPS